MIQDMAKPVNRACRSMASSNSDSAWACLLYNKNWKHCQGKPTILHTMPAGWLKIPNKYCPIIVGIAWKNKTGQESDLESL